MKVSDQNKQTQRTHSDCYIRKGGDKKGKKKGEHTLYRRALPNSVKCLILIEDLWFDLLLHWWSSDTFNCCYLYHILIMFTVIFMWKRLCVLWGTNEQHKHNGDILHRSKTTSSTSLSSQVAPDGCSQKPFVRREITAALWLSSGFCVMCNVLCLLLLALVSFSLWSGTG